MRSRWVPVCPARVASQDGKLGSQEGSRSS